MDIVRSSHLNNGTTQQKSANQLKAFPSVPKTLPDELKRDKRRLLEDRRVNDRNSSPFQSSQNNRNRFDSLDVPLSPPKAASSFKSNNQNNDNAFQTPNRSFGDRLNTNSNVNAGSKVPSRRPPLSYTSLPSQNDRLQSLRSGRRLEHDRNVNSKNQIILEKTPNSLGSTRRPPTNTLNEVNPSRNQIGDDSRGRNPFKTDTRDQQPNTFQGNAVKRPPVDYRTLLDNDERTTNGRFNQGML